MKESKVTSVALAIIAIIMIDFITPEGHISLKKSLKKESNSQTSQLILTTCINLLNKIRESSTITICVFDGTTIRLRKNINKTLVSRLMPSKHKEISRKLEKKA